MYRLLFYFMLFYFIALYLYTSWIEMGSGISLLNDDDDIHVLWSTKGR